MFEIRPATPDEVEVLRDIEVDAGDRFREVGLAAIAEDDPPSAAELLEQIERGRLWAAADGDTIAGYVMVSIVDGAGHVDQVSVRTSAAGRGVGRALMGRAHEWARRSGLTTMTLTTFVEVPFNGPYYQRLGYEVVPEAELGPELAAIRAAETDAGLDLSPRAAMRLDLTGDDDA